jgi:hypothetical protein
MGSDTIFHGSRLSAYEHLVPEKFWTNEQNPGEGVSAVKALAKAAAAGQKIYTLTAQNAAMVYRLQVDDAIRMEIQNALNAGRTVTVHEAPFTVSGWTGTGYIIDDPATGAGAYKISGGMNGGSLWVPIIGILAMTIAFVPFVLMAAYMGLIYLSILTAFIYALVFCELQELPNSVLQSDLSNIAYAIMWFSWLLPYVNMTKITEFFVAVLFGGAMQNHMCLLDDKSRALFLIRDDSYA